nr:hypothetical protein [uncultured Prevotella sp.]
MNKVLDFHRLAMVLRWDALSNWKKYVRSTLGLAFVFSFICIFYQFNWRSNGYVTYNDVKDLYLGSVSGMFMFISFIIFFFCGSRIFINMKTKASRSLFLMLPVTNMEKFISRLLYTVLGTSLMIVASWIIADIIQFVFSLFLTPGMQGSLVGTVFEELFLKNNFDSSHFVVRNGTSVLGQTFPVGTFLLSLTIFTHSFFTLGGTVFRKSATLLTICSSFILMFLTALISSFVDADVLRHLVQSMEPNTFGWLMVNVFLLLSVFNYWASYKLFTHMQIINNKWFNIL